MKTNKDFSEIKKMLSGACRVPNKKSYDKIFGVSKTITVSELNREKINDINGSRIPFTNMINYLSKIGNYHEICSILKTEWKKQIFACYEPKFIREEIMKVKKENGKKKISILTLKKYFPAPAGWTIFKNKFKIDKNYDFGSMNVKYYGLPTFWTEHFTDFEIRRLILETFDEVMYPK